MVCSRKHYSYLSRWVARCVLFCSETFEANRWHEDCRFCTPMIVHGDQHLSIGDIVELEDPEYGQCWGKLVKFMVEVN